MFPDEAIGDRGERLCIARCLSRCCGMALSSRVDTKPALFSTFQGSPASLGECRDLSKGAEGFGNLPLIALDPVDDPPGFHACVRYPQEKTRHMTIPDLGCAPMKAAGCGRRRAVSDFLSPKGLLLSLLPRMLPGVPFSCEIDGY